MKFGETGFTRVAGVCDLRHAAYFATVSVSGVEPPAGPCDCSTNKTQDQASVYLIRLTTSCIQRNRISSPDASCTSQIILSSTGKLLPNKQCRAATLHMQPPPGCSRLAIKQLKAFSHFDSLVKLGWPADDLIDVARASGGTFSSAKMTTARSQMASKHSVHGPKSDHTPGQHGRQALCCTHAVRACPSCFGLAEVCSYTWQVQLAGCVHNYSTAESSGCCKNFHIRTSK